MSPWNRLVSHVVSISSAGLKPGPTSCPALLAQQAEEAATLRLGHFLLRMPARSNAIAWNAGVSLLSLSSAIGLPLLSALSAGR